MEEEFCSLCGVPVMFAWDLCEDCENDEDLLEDE